MRSSLPSLAAPSLVLAAGIFVFAGAAVAEPQALGLLASDAPIPVTCDAQGCQASLTSFCLERDRASPQAGDPYRIAAGAVRLLVRQDGGEEVVSANEMAIFTADRGHRTVSIRLSEGLAAQWRDAKLFLEVGPGVTLLPVETEDGAGRDAVEIAALTGPLRDLGSRIVDGVSAKSDTLRLLNRAINALPKLGRGGLAQSEAVWEQSLPADGTARRLAQRTYESCEDKTRSGLYYSFRNCLAVAHDKLIMQLNERYWDARAGS